MQTSYAVKWREPDGSIYLGRLELGPKGLVLEGAENGHEGVRRELGYDELTALRLGRLTHERLDGQPSLVVDRPGGAFVITSSVLHAGVVQEVVERLAALRLGRTRRVTIVVPLREGMHARARELAASGPPFDPEGTLLVRHQLLLTRSEAIFVFEADSDEAFEGLLGQVDVWAAAAAWREIVDGPPRLAEVVYGWERQARPQGVGLGF
jgi:hypothetical protein